MARGRKKGSTSGPNVINISIKTLAELLPQGQDAVVPVRRIWLEQMGSLLGVEFIPNQDPKRIVKEEAATVRPVEEESDRDAAPRERIVIAPEEID